MTRALRAISLACIAACHAPDPSEDPAAAARPGGATTVDDRSENAFGFPAANLDPARSDDFFVGNSFFKGNWVIAPASTEDRDGLGPFFNAASCSSCHFKDGRGRPPGDDLPHAAGLLLRLGRPGVTAHGAPRPDPVYGDQLQPMALPGIRPEAELRVAYTEVPGQYADGTPFHLRRPAYTVADPAYGALEGDLLTSPRVAPALIGVGLLESVPEARLVALADPDDADGDGVSGRPNRVHAVGSDTPAIGRFGWKANQPTVKQQVAAAFVGDIGITSTLFPEENATVHQEDARQRPVGGSPELDDRTLDFVSFYTRTLAVPARRNPEAPEVQRGRELFQAAGCAACHVPRHDTGDDPSFPELSRQTIFPYTDLLLHDMGEGLADGRPDFEADGREWRTPPLWGLGLQQRVNGHRLLLHDGRARGVAEAILWHGGEAETSREAFRRLDAPDREALIAFVEDL